MPEYKQNPTPAQVFDLTITVDKAPGPFLVVKGVMQYDITNMDCLPPADFFSGVQTTPTSIFLPIALKKIKSNTYEGRVSMDGVLNDDYFGHGLCRIKATASTIRFQASDAKSDTQFFARMYADDIETNPQKTSYHWRGLYPKQQRVDGYPDHGLASPDEFKESLRSDLFSITIAARKVAP
ncbi:MULTISPECIES: hypothetical protein [unclassified Lysobacter]|uniref:hypothetical protein n=1 Tax=unclassified Lysobacter TaxID=2635362 RepID=UPI001BEAEAAB|nr:MULTISPECIES: hypothetical protein [unclassified Lysobacter]MBT2748315.1 hypothetical protein [Lysobacter sp. ISL-42]MBT2749918.1 hypothetical protein [Lysobacter sp. ISL-50]MBT2781246.1 hypothetical protein [Lysobacter sp. ISL-52]